MGTKITTQLVIFRYCHFCAEKHLIEKNTNQESGDPKKKDGRANVMVTHGQKFIKTQPNGHGGKHTGMGKAAKLAI